MENNDSNYIPDFAGRNNKDAEEYINFVKSRAKEDIWNRTATRKSLYDLAKKLRSVAVKGRDVSIGSVHIQAYWPTMAEDTDRSRRQRHNNDLFKGLVEFLVKDAATSGCLQKAGMLWQQPKDDPYAPEVVKCIQSFFKLYESKKKPEEQDKLNFLLNSICDISKTVHIGHGVPDWGDLNGNKDHKRKDQKLNILNWLVREVFLPTVKGVLEDEEEFEDARQEGSPSPGHAADQAALALAKTDPNALIESLSDEQGVAVATEVATKVANIAIQAGVQVISKREETRQEEEKTQQEEEKTQRAKYEAETARIKLREKDKEAENEFLLSLGRMGTPALSTAGSSRRSTTGGRGRQSTPSAGETTTGRRRIQRSKLLKSPFSPRAPKKLFQSAAKAPPKAPRRAPATPEEMDRLDDIDSPPADSPFADDDSEEEKKEEDSPSSEELGEDFGGVEPMDVSSPEGSPNGGSDGSEEPRAIRRGGRQQGREARSSPLQNIGRAVRRVASALSPLSPQPAARRSDRLRRKRNQP